MKPRLTFRRLDGTVHLFINGAFVAGGFASQLLGLQWFMRHGG